MFTNEFLNSPMGQAAMDYAEQVYASSFKAEEFTLAEYPEMLDELVSYHMEPVYKHEPADPLFRDDDEFFDAPDSPDLEIIHDGMTREQAESMAKVSTYVWLVNYKGEGEGFILKELAANMSRYHGKWNYSED